MLQWIPARLWRITDLREQDLEMGISDSLQWIFFVGPAPAVLLFVFLSALDDMGGERQTVKFLDSQKLTTAWLEESSMMKENII